MTTGHNYSSIRFGVETFPARTVRPRHRHLAGDATIILGGSFVECSFAGRFAVEAGDVLLHGTFDCHADAAHGRLPIQVLRLPWEDASVEGQFRVRDPDGLVRVAERDPREAMNALACEIRAVKPRESHWTGVLAVTLSGGSLLSLRQWKEASDQTNFRADSAASSESRQGCSGSRLVRGRLGKGSFAQTARSRVLHMTMISRTSPI
jgi:hypothetical protein